MTRTVLALDLGIGEELGEADRDAGEDLAEAGDRRADAVRLYHRDRGVGDAGALRQRPLRQPFAKAQRPKPGADIDLEMRSVHVFRI